MIGEGVEITDNTGTVKKGETAQANNLYLSRHLNSYNNAAVMVSGDTWAETRVGLTLSNGSDVFTRTLNEEGGVRFEEDYSKWFFGDAGDSMRPVFDGDEGLMRLNFCPPAGEAVECTAESSEDAIRQCTFVPSEATKDLTEADKADYTEMFVAVARPVSGKENVWSVTFELTPEATNKLEKAVNDVSGQVLAAVSAMSAAATGEPVAVEMDAVPGFYYAVRYGTTPDVSRNTDGALATGPKLKLDRPVVKGASAFFRMVVSEKPIPARGE